MFHNNKLLIQLKQQLHSKILRVEGIVKATEKGFGFLKVAAIQKSYFISISQMKKVMHGDRISAVIRIKKNRELAEPEILIEPFLNRFVGKVYKKGHHLFIIPDNILFKAIIPCFVTCNLNYEFKDGDWAVAEMRQHPLKGDRGFYAELMQFIVSTENNFVPWLVTLERYNLEKEAPNSIVGEILEEELVRFDLTKLDFITIDNASTEDIDDALYVEKTIDGKLQLTVAIADPTAWIAEDSDLDNITKIRAFTNYLPGFTIPMLPRKLSNVICSLHPHKIRPVLACRMIITKDGAIEDNFNFFAAKIKSKAKLVYEEVSDWLDNIGNWHPQDEVIINQLLLLRNIYLSRIKWRANFASVFKDRPNYHFILDNKGNVLDITIELKRIANHIVEEAMLAANICAARTLRDKLGFGIYNVHTGFNSTTSEIIVALLKKYNIHVDPKELFTLSGFCKLYRKINMIPSRYLEGCLRRFQALSKISIYPAPHFGLGLEVYATWTSPIRKYGDMINHRLLKSIIKGKSTICPQKKTLHQIIERRRLYRAAKRDINDWLYANFLQEKVGTNNSFIGEIIDIRHSGMKVLLVNNGAIVFIPASFIHNIRNELACNQEIGIVKIKGKTIYKITDIIRVLITEIRMETRSIIACPIV